ncbi:MAG TPA: hypothetical protein VGO91_03150 [Pyrinomonadaceae bacterium]|nr:hypothetical protein [Pyrinomonadaceae bacterium]
MRIIHLLILAMLGFSCGAVAYAQDKQATPAPSPPRPAQGAQGQRQTPPAQRPGNNFDLTEYGVQIRPEPRLIVMMAALDAAGFDPTPAGKATDFFRAQVRKDQSDLDQNLRQRLRTFYERNRLPAPATPAEQAARYVSLAYALGPGPTFDAPPRSEELPSSILEVLDFAPLVQEFYRKSGIEERLPAYLKSYQAEGDQMRRPTAEMVRFALSYLHTRPIIITTERVEVRNPSASQKKNKKEGQKFYTERDRERRFFIVPDLLAVPGTINFRVIADDYYAIAPPGTDPASSELRRAYLQYVIDPLVVRYNRDIAARREPLRQLIDEAAKRTGQTASPDIFLMVSRSLVAAADARLDETLRLDALAREARGRLDQTKDAATRASAVKAMQEKQSAIADDTVAQLAEAYENGATLAFYFSEQLRGLEVSGFDISNFFADMIASFDPARELRRPAEYATPRARAVAARKARQAQRNALNESGPTEATEAGSSHNAALVKQLVEVDSMLRLKNYEAAETRLRQLMTDFPREPRIFFALGQTASLSARDAIDEDVQSERLNRALAHYRDAVSAASADTDQALVSRAHEAMGRILAFLERPAEAAKEFDAAIQLGDIKGGAYQDAVAGKSKLAQPQ